MRKPSYIHESLIFRLLMQEITDQIFMGCEGGRFFSHNLDFINKGSYEIAGKLVAFSLLHGGPGVPVMHPLAFHLMVHGDFGNEELPTIEDCIFDMDSREKLTQVRKYLFLLTCLSSV